MTSAQHTHPRLLAQSGGTLFPSISSEAIRRGNFHSVGELREAVDQYLSAHNQQPKRFQWTVDANTILAKNAHLCIELQ